MQFRLMSISFHCGTILTPMLDHGGEANFESDCHRSIPVAVFQEASIDWVTPWSHAVSIRSPISENEGCSFM